MCRYALVLMAFIRAPHRDSDHLAIFAQVKPVESRVVWRAASLCTLRTAIRQAPARAALLPTRKAKAQQAGETTARASLQQVSLLQGRRLAVAWQQHMMDPWHEESSRLQH